MSQFYITNVEKINIKVHNVLLYKNKKAVFNEREIILLDEMNIILSIKGDDFIHFIPYALSNNYLILFNYIGNIIKIYDIINDKWLEDITLGFGDCYNFEISDKFNKLYINFNGNIYVYDLKNTIPPNPLLMNLDILNFSIADDLIIYLSNSILYYYDLIDRKSEIIIKYDITLLIMKLLEGNIVCLIFPYDALFTISMIDISDKNNIKIMKNLELNQIGKDGWQLLTKINNDLILYRDIDDNKLHIKVYNLDSKFIIDSLLEFDSNLYNCKIHSNNINELVLIDIFNNELISCKISLIDIK
jgi:hypothetical protein